MSFVLELSFRPLVLLITATLLVSGCVGDPPEGRQSRRSPDVELTSGKELPDFVGTKKADAERILRELDLEFFIDPAGPPYDDLVVGQDPSAGVTVEASSQVVLSVRCQPAPCPSPEKGKSIYDPCSCAAR